MHTPGPWDVPLEGRIRGPNGEWLWHIEDYGNGVPDPERCEADARLIAVAPELLEALEGTEEILERLRVWTATGEDSDSVLPEEVGEVLRLISAAITKAREESESAPPKEGASR